VSKQRGNRAGRPTVGRWLPLFLLGLIALLGAGLLAPGVSPAGGVRAAEDVIDLEFTYGSEKEEWIKDVTAAFHNDPGQTVQGKRIRVNAVPLGSGEAIEEVLDERLKLPKGRVKPHLISPASAAFIKLGNADWRKKSGKGEDLIGPTRNLVRSPVVIAMWKPMAEALGWPKRPVSWDDILDLSTDEKGWSKRDPALGVWDPFKWAHTHPELSNSGLISIFAEVYAAPNVRKQFNLTREDVENPETGRFIERIEQSVVYYGRSTGFFAKKMFNGGPRYLSAAVMYENMVIESYDRTKFKPFFDVVAVYPKEGTFMSDHPVGIVQREWVTEQHREAAQKYIDYLMQPAQQEKALKYGFRPGLETVRLAAPIDAEHGVDPAQPQNQLQVPPADVMEAIRSLWQKHRKMTSMILVMDTSGSMANEDRLTNAKIGAREFIEKLGDRDLFSVIPFSTHVVPEAAQLRLNAHENRQRALDYINRLTPEGETALYDAIDSAYRVSQADDHKKLIPTIIVLTDGLNNRSGDGAVPNRRENERALQQLLDGIKRSERRPVRIFLIGYSLDASKPEEKLAIDALQRIAKATEGEFYAADPDTILKMFRVIRSQ
jgi:Ca-activated chloride channel family protein